MPSAMRLDTTISNQLTTARIEVKYRLNQTQFINVLGMLRKHAVPKLVNGVASSYRMSVYLDTAERRFSRAELRHVRPSVKLRLRDYYWRNGDTPVFGDTCYAELKQRTGQLVEKKRLPIPRESVLRAAEGESLSSTDAGLRELCSSLEEPMKRRPLEALFIVHYRRYTLEHETAGCRVTFDDDVTYHMASGAASATSKSEGPALSRPFLVDPMGIIEVKRLGASPKWVDDALKRHDASPHSKFGIGVRELMRRGMLFRS